MHLGTIVLASKFGVVVVMNTHALHPLRTCTQLVVVVTHFVYEERENKATIIVSNG